MVLTDELGEQVAHWGLRRPRLTYRKPLEAMLAG